MLRPEKVTLSGIRRYACGLGGGGQRLLAVWKASYKRKKILNLWRPSSWGSAVMMGICSHDVHVGLPGAASMLPALPACAKGPDAPSCAACSRGPASPCLLAPGSLAPQGPLGLPAHQDYVYQDHVRVFFSPTSSVWFSSLMLL